MKTLTIIVCAAFALVMGAKAGVPNDTAYTSQMAYLADYFSYTGTNVTAAVTNLIGNTNQVDGNLYHTFHIYNYSTNAISYVIDKTISGTNWVAGATNTVASGVNAEATITGKESLFRMRFINTNAQFEADYLGGR